MSNAEELGRLLRSGAIDEGDITTTVEANFTVPDGEDPIAYAMYYSERLNVLTQAHLRFGLLAASYGQSNLEYERYYRGLYDDIVSHRNVWFDSIFRVGAPPDDTPNPHPEYAERTAAILGTLCTILRQRGDLDECMEVMDTYTAVLERYQQMSNEDVCDDPAQIECCELLTYKYNLIKINCGVQLPDEAMAVRAFRDAVSYERKLKAAGKFDEDDDDAYADYDFVYTQYFGHDRFDTLSDSEVFKALKYLCGGHPEGEPDGCELRACGRCDVREAMFGDHKRCARCQSEHYCSKKCQIEDWAFHKHICGKNNTTDLPSGALAGIAKVVTVNHTRTVEDQSGRSVPRCQKDAARVALIKQLKTWFTGDFRHFNSRHGACDAGRDPEFNAALADFFAEQPGYEKVWGDLRVGLKEKWERELERSKTDHQININEDAMRHVCENLAQTLVCQFHGAIQPTQQSEGWDASKQHEKLVGELIKLVKTFALENPQYNSNLGFADMVNNDEFKERMISSIFSTLEF